MHRLWFRLDDVLPLAEHALSCFTHRRTETHAGLVPAGPALVWTSSPIMDLLTSNGLPTWYGNHGAHHAAEAYAWYDASGRYGTAWRDDHHTGVLPLTDPAGTARPVVERLRAARHSVRRWVTVAIDPADGNLIGSHQVQVVAGRHDLVPTGTTWTAANVTCPAVRNRSYPALVPDGYRSDSGDLLARFDRPTIARMAADLDTLHANPDRHPDPMPGEHPILRLRENLLIVIDKHDGGDTTREQSVDELIPDADGRYPLGAYLWPWQHATDTSQ